METFDEVNRQPEKRPVFLTVTGILTFVNSGFGVISSLMGYFSGPASPDKIENLTAQNMAQIATIRDQGMPGMADAMETMVRSVEYTNEAHYLATTLNLCVYVLAIAGALMMLRGQRVGLHFYIISCLLRIGSFYMYIPAADVSGILVGYFTFTSALFILFYSLNRKWMR